MKPLLSWNNWCWLAKAEKLTVIKMIAASPRRVNLFSGLAVCPRGLRLHLMLAVELQSLPGSTGGKKVPESSWGLAPRGMVEVTEREARLVKAQPNCNGKVQHFGDASTMQQLSRTSVWSAELWDYEQAMRAGLEKWRPLQPRSWISHAWHWKWLYFDLNEQCPSYSLLYVSIVTPNQCIPIPFLPCQKYWVKIYKNTKT